MAQCLTPYIVKDENKLNIPVPCGRCPPCHKRRISAWSFRLMQQDKISTSSYFITLTYDTNSVPITRAGFLNLRKRDVQLFCKRLRRLHEGEKTKGIHSLPIKYYCAGEYGGKSYRPHYHLIIFNVQLELVLSKQELLLIKQTNYDGKTPISLKGWDNGRATIGKLSEASVGYTMKYISKTKRIPLHKNDDRIPEFGLMSKGLGLNYITPQMKKWHEQDLLNRCHIVIEDGKKIAMPRYIKDKLYSQENRSIIKGYWKGEMEKQLDKQLENPNYYHEKSQRDIAAFRNLSLDERKRNKI